MEKVKMMFKICIGQVLFVGWAMYWFGLSSSYVGHVFPPNDTPVSWELPLGIMGMIGISGFLGGWAALEIAKGKQDQPDA